MKRCDFDALSLFLDGALSLAQHRRVTDHLHHCAVCRGELARLRRVDHILAAWGGMQTSIPVATEARVQQSVDRRRRTRTLVNLSRMMPAALGTSVAAVLVLVSANLAPLYRGGGPSTTSPSQPVALKMLKQQSAPLRFQRGKSAVVDTHTAPPPAVVHHLAQLDDIY